MTPHRYPILGVMHSWLIVGLACTPDDQPLPDGLPQLAWEAERVVLGTNLIDEVCLGTLVSLDAAVASIEAELNLEPSSDKIAFYVLDDATFIEECGDGPAIACTKGAAVFSSSEGFQYKRHELVHARLGQLGIRSIPLFDEGIAAALDRDGGCLASDRCINADLDALLMASNSEQLGLLGGFTAGADLAHGIIAVHGPDALLAFMSEIASDQHPNEIRSIYLQHFGSVLDEDFQAYKRGAHDHYTAAQRGCDGLITAPASESGVMIETTMDCDSPLVVNVFSSPGVGRIEWSIPVTIEQAGYLEFSSTANVRVSGCYPPNFNHQELLDYGPWSYAWPEVGVEPVKLYQGSYVLRWTSEFGSALTFDMAPPCIFENQDCDEGEQCTIWNECRPEATEPVALGSPCEQEEGGPLSCEAGSRCSGDVCVAECDGSQECPNEQSCARFRVCGDICDLLAQDCTPGFACVPSADLELNALGLGACIAAGSSDEFAACDPSVGSCLPGLTCEASGSCINNSATCCVPLCDATTPSTACPEAISQCDPIVDGPVGVCAVGSSEP